MNTNLKIPTKKIFRYSFLGLILVFVILLALLVSFLNEYVYQAINVDSEFLLSQRKTTQENLDSKSLDEVLEVIKNKSKNHDIENINNIFD